MLSWGVPKLRHAVLQVYALISIDRLRAEVVSCIQLCGLEAPGFLHHAPAGWDGPLLPCWQRVSHICFGLSWLGRGVAHPPLPTASASSAIYVYIAPRTLSSSRAAWAKAV